MKYTNEIFFALVLSALVGCAGTNFKFENARKVQVGMTKAEVESLMGRPYMVTSKPDGQELWVWSHANGMTGSSKTISFPFKDGKVEATPQIPNSFK